MSEKNGQHGIARSRDISAAQAPRFLLLAGCTTLLVQFKRTAGALANRMRHYGVVASAGSH